MQKLSSERTTANRTPTFARQRLLELFQRLGISYDLYTSTHTENHFRVSQDMFKQLLKNEYLYRKVTPQMYSPETGKFLPDRYVEGTCPNCGYTGARGPAPVRHCPLGIKQR